MQLGQQSLAKEKRMFELENILGAIVLAQIYIAVNLRDIVKELRAIRESKER